MRITIFTAGSTGDILPCIILGNGLVHAGFTVHVAAPQNFADLIQAHGLVCQPLRGDVQQIMAGETGRKFMEKGGNNPIQSIISMRKMIGPIALQMAEDALEACRQADALISLAVFAPLGKTLAEICRIPVIYVEPTPLLPTRNFPAPSWPVQKKLGGLHNLLSGTATLQMIWQWYRPFVNMFRQRFGLAPLKGADFQRALASVPLLGAYSPTVIAPPNDWPEHTHITGYWFRDSPPNWRPSPELENFLNQGPPPIYIGFGSMAGRSPDHFAKLVLEALAKSEQRGVLATGWGGMQVLQVPENVFVLESAPHSWLFPHMAAVVHHGGAGTTAEGLRAGIPTVIIPFIVDQRFWGNRIQELGIGPAPIPAKQLTANSLENAIRIAASDPAMKQRAAAIGAAIRTEDGVGKAVKLIKQYLGA